ncbi:MAG: outer membrane protein assembly factor BamA, partial [Spirochaetales bacterium]|nr:outer membrane protein assembly factor BamA [Spirochaetales bacterium]
MRKSVLALSFMFFAVVCGFAQDSDEWYIGKTIKNITFKGFVTVSSNEVNGVVEPYRGKSFSQELLDEMVSTLYALDYFERVTPASLPSEGSYEAVTIEFTVVERPIIGEIRFTGNKKISAGTLREEILIKTGDMLNKTRVLMDEETVRKHYLEKGFPGVKVTSSIEDNERNQRKIVIFQITEGNQTTIRSLQFVGNNVFSSRTLKGQMESGEQWFFNSGVFNEQTFEEDKRKIESFYKERGYIDAKVDNVLKEEEVSEEDGRTYLALTIYLSEGNQFQYGGMTFEGNQLFSTETLSDSLRVKPEGPINLPRVDADYQRIIDLYSENGYIFNDIRRQEVRDELRRTVSYIVEITERNRAHIENIIIRGNKKTKSYVLERELLMESGDIFSKSKIMESLNNLYNLQYFSNINVETPEGSAYGLMDLIFNVEESSMSEIMFGLAFGGSADFPVSANVRWTDRNFFGRGQVFSIDVTASPVMQSLTFNFLEKWLLGKRWSGNFDFTIRHTQYSGIPQDILAPLYTGSKPGIDAFPDPFTGEYVYASNGQPWRGGVGADGKPSAADIDRFNLVTDYEYAGGNTAIVPNQYKMSYEAVDFSLGFGTGYRFRTPLGILGPGIGARTTLTYLQYDDALYRPYLAADRANHGTWMF